MGRKKCIHLPKTFHIFSNTDEFLLHTVSKIDSCNRFNICFESKPEKIKDAGSIVNICQRQARGSLLLRFCQQLCRAHGAVFKAEIGVTVKKHFYPSLQT